jgi:hypothetical protein
MVIAGGPCMHFRSAAELTPQAIAANREQVLLRCFARSVRYGPKPPLKFRLASGRFTRFAVTDRRAEGMDSTAGSGHGPAVVVEATIRPCRPDLPP